MIEEWRDIPGFEGRYQVSNQGRVRSLDRLMQRSHDKEPYLKRGRVLCLADNGNGYKKVNLGEGNQRYVHRLVLFAFCTDGYSAGLVPNHKDGNKANNKLSNLEWVTRTQNNLHAYETGLKRKGEDHVQAILSNEAVAFIKANHKKFSSGELGTQGLAQKYGISPRYVMGILHGRKRRVV